MSSSIWNGTVQHSPRRRHLFPLLSLRSSGHASSPDTRSFRNSVHSPSLPRTSGSSFLRSSYLWHGGVRAGKISPLLNGNVCYCISRPYCITAKSRIIRLYGVGYWQVAGVMQGISTHMISLWETGSGSSSIIRARGFTVHAKTSSQNRCGGASFTVPLNC